MLLRYGVGNVAEEDRKSDLLFVIDVACDLGIYLLLLAHQLHVWIIHGVSLTIIDGILLIQTKSVLLSMIQRIKQYKRYREALNLVDRTSAHFYRSRDPATMVLIHFKNSEEHQFLCEVPGATDVDQVIRQLVEIHNLRLRVTRLVSYAKDLVDYGPAKPEDQWGLDDADESGAKKTETATYKPDPSGRRNGSFPPKEMADIINKTLEEAKVVASKNQVDKKVNMTASMLTEAIDRVRGAVMIVWPMGLPEWDPVKQILEGTEALDGTQASLEVLDPDTATMWWAGKQLFRGQPLSSFVGKNEKTKIVAKMQKKGSGAPAREAPIDAETQKAMMAFYYKKQEEQKKLADDDEDSYLNSAWANPKALKQHFLGVGSDISWKPR
eukprot:tig00000076_g2386.t1